MNDNNLLTALRLIRSEGVGPVMYRRLLARFGSAEKALLALPNLQKPGGRKLLPCSVAQAEAELENLYKAGGRIIHEDDADYPALLKNIDDAPPLISVLGRVELLQQPSLAIIGARNATLNGRRFAERLARELGEHHYTIVSGLARGIDTAAHMGSLASGTIAVLAGGVDNIYPPENKDLYARIAENGVILSEMPWGIVPTNQHFPRRNRLIAGLAQATIIVEAALKSGSLITTRLALEQGREVFAVPGSPMDPRHAGPNQLIKTGQAQLIEGSQDILEALSLISAQRITPMRKNLNLFSNNDNIDLNEDTEFMLDVLHTVNDLENNREAPAPANAYEHILNALSTAPTSTDILVQNTGLPVEDVLAILLELELAGRLQRQPGNMVALIAA
ncbi:MAG TPA: DNA-processing protein DprA [Alphaproteobacteria bacterium]